MFRDFFMTFYFEKYCKCSFKTVPNKQKLFKQIF